ncbi:CX domain-containing protein [Caenorhabditis elegans]|uniref:CX domain-containing protein n=3 Tax=Caenorhabditis elegans TaxID=6239 RepID=Q18614_CAEEL|nr:CX domain-containing protein [Caenorhabditis elegans]CAA93643.1 CX domain-containing protein [Caenorhabditis elegans]|eukprot:NP_509961.1 Uncharacterized protein CELE_C44C10.9 [Caenorhabditis elegans]
MEIALQGDSKGILYEGYTKAFKQCIFEEGDVEGKNERYEFRCDYDLECCGRTCCIPQATTIPFWLMLILIALAIFLIALLLACLAYYLAKYLKSRPKKEKFIPSPMQETTLMMPKPVQITQRNEDEISRASVAQHVEPAPLSPQRAHNAFYRPFVADDVDDRDMPAPLRGSISYHSVNELTNSQFGTIKTIEKPKDRSSERMYKRPGFDNVPSY